MRSYWEDGQDGFPRFAQVAGVELWWMAFGLTFSARAVSSSEGVTTPVVGRCCPTTKAGTLGSGGSI